MSTIDEIVSRIKTLGSSLHALKATKEEQQVETVLAEIKTLKLQYQQMTGIEFEGGTVLLTPRGGASEERTPPPLPPSAEAEAAAATTTYSSSIVALVTKLVGLKRHGTPLFDANAIVQFLLTNMTTDTTHKALAGTSDAQKEEVAGWMGFSAKVDTTPHAEFSPALALQFRTVIAPGTQPYFVLGSAPTLADLSLFFALSVCPLAEETLDANTLAWRSAVASFIATVDAQPTPESPPPPTPRGLSATALAEAHLASITKIPDDLEENADPARDPAPVNTSKISPALTAPDTTVEAMGARKNIANISTKTAETATAKA